MECFFFIHLFIWLHWVLVVSRGILTAACRLSELRCAGSRAWGLSSYKTRAQCPAACGILVPGPDIEPLSSALCRLKNSHSLRVENCFIWWECLGLRVQEASLQLWENCSKEAGWGEVRLYTSLKQREWAVWSPKIRYQVKEFSILCMGRCKPLGSLNLFLSSAPQGFPFAWWYIIWAVRDTGSISGSERSLRERNGNPH